MNSLSRRWFLQGSGAALAIPALPSLLVGSEAKAATPEEAIFMAFHSAFGGIWNSNFFPASPNATETRAYAGRNIRRTTLTPTISNGRTFLSNVLNAPSSLLTPALVAKMNAIAGIDIPFEVNHHTSVTWGNCNGGDIINFDTTIGNVLKANARPTIDQVIAQSPAFYRQGQAFIKDSIEYCHFDGNGAGQGLSWRWNNKANHALGITKTDYYMSAQSLWDVLFSGFSGPAPSRPAVIDLVKADYQRTLNNRRLSQLDKQRLNEHMQRVADLERRLATQITSCTPVIRPTSNSQIACAAPQNNVDFYRSFEDVVIAALQCGLTRVATCLFNGWESTFGNKCHQPWHDLSHQVVDVAPQNAIVSAFNKQFAGVIVPLVSKLNSSLDGQGRSLLDKSLIMWSCEHGTYSHGHENLPYITFGGANGGMLTGNHLDYRDMNRVLQVGQYGDNVGEGRAHVGLTIHQLQASMLKSVGIPQTEWAEMSHGGYGFKPPRFKARQDNWGTNEWNAAADKLPFL